MNRIRIALARTVILPLVALAAAAFVGTPTSAAMTVGQPYAGIDPSASQANVSIAPRRNYDADGSTYEGFAAGGVMTSISVKTSQNAGTVNVSVLRKTADLNANDASFLSMSTTNISVPQDLSTAGSVTTVPTRFLVAAGDRFAATSLSSGTNYLGSLPSIDPADMNHCFYYFAMHQTGETNNYFSVSCNNYVPLVQGTIEADADGDGYGDETQDLCPSDPTRQTACWVPSPLMAPNLVISAVKSKARPGSTATRRFQITNVGGTIASPVTIKVVSSKKVKRIKYASSLAQILPGGGSAVLKVSVTPKTAGSTTLTVTMSTPGEIGTADNWATSKVKFKLKK